MDNPQLLLSEFGASLGEKYFQKLSHNISKFVLDAVASHQITELINKTRKVLAGGKAEKPVRTPIEAVRSLLPEKPENLYGEIAVACEEVNDAMLREASGTTGKITKIAAGKIGAFSASAGILGIASTVGTAATGTAIGVLSGAAATSASLAWLGGTVAMGTAIVGTAMVAGGVGFGAGAYWLYQKQWQGKKRLREELSERERRLIEVSTKLAQACRRLAMEGEEPSPEIAKVLFDETIEPLSAELQEEQQEYREWPHGARGRVKKALALLNDIAMRLKHIGRKSPTYTISFFSAAIVSILNGDLSGLSADQELVLDALRRSKNDLTDASNDELIDYVQSLSDSQMDGVINNVKGIYHELLFVAAENSDGDQYRAAIFQATNHPGADVIITDTVTGSVKSIQLKATQYRSYLNEHKERYEEFAIYATDEVAAMDSDVQSSGLSNAKITDDTEEVFSKLDEAGGSPVLDAMTTSAAFALAFQLGRVLKTKNVSKEALQKSTKEITVAAFLSGLAVWAVE